MKHFFISSIQKKKQQKKHTRAMKTGKQMTEDNNSVNWLRKTGESWTLTLVEGRQNKKKQVLRKDITNLKQESYAIYF